MADPREGVTPEGLIVTGARRDRVPAAYEPVLAYVLGRVPPEVSVHVYGSVANGTATEPTSDVDLLTIGLPATYASALGAEASAAFDRVCRGVEIAAASSDDYAGDGDEAYGNRVFLRHYCAHLAGPDPGEALPGFPADARAARGFNGDIERALRRWRAALGRDDPSDLSRRIARKSLLALAGLVSVHDGTWTTDRFAAAARWSEIEPTLAPELARLRTLCDSGGASADETEAMLAGGGVIESIATRFAAEIGLWQP
ncbi:nucleotidyltransferase domain-containing protein [Nocardioides sp. NPDC127514]|uniref:nucleotidyltransferase domain-containing protein n=1 Tax=unclassified Nocardioides TaxID=2615069 RepID=UPI00332416C1